MKSLQFPGPLRHSSPKDRSRKDSSEKGKVDVDDTTIACMKFREWSSRSVRVELAYFGENRLSPLRSLWHHGKYPIQLREIE